MVRILAVLYTRDCEVKLSRLGTRCWLKQPLGIVSIQSRSKIMSGSRKSKQTTKQGGVINWVSRGRECDMQGRGRCR